MMRKRIAGVFVALLACAFAAQAETFDLVICGSSSAGIAAAVEAKRHGLKAVVLSATPRIGGLTTGGLGQTDIGCKEAYGGISREFYRAIKAHYADPANWTWQRSGDYRPGGQSAYARQEDAMWTFEPSAALAVLEGWEKRDGLDIRRGERLDRTPGKVKVEGEGEQRRIVSIFTESGREYCGRMFVDATYEGDLMAAAGCRYAVGREANATYGETVNGIQRAEAHGNQLPEGIDPYVVKGDPSSGLIRGVESDDARPDGAGDDRVQAYCFRMCLTDVPENRIPFAKPEGYDERDYEILFRFLESSPTAMPQPPGVSAMPNRKTDTNNGGGFFSDYIGANWRWPEASYAERDRIAAEHLRYQRGLMWTCANHPRVPERVRREFSKWGTCRDEFAGERGDGWQDQLYVREARRLVGETVMTERHCRGLAYVARPVAKGAYSMDSHNVRRYVTKEGWVRNEGDVQDWRVERPYDIDYGAIVPKRGECGNLFVPVCLSASHIAYGSIRMEPVFFALGQAAGAAAAVALRSGAAAVQDVDYAALAKVLRDEGQVFGSTTKLPMFFTDDMVLQRGVKFPVWGNDVPGTQVEVSFGDATVRTTADAEGRWSLELPALEASATGRPFTVKGTSTIILKDVVVGDLWFVAGPETLGGVRKTPGKYPAFPEGIGPLFGSASAPRVASVWWDSYSQLSRRPEMHPWRKGADGTSTPVGVLDATWPGCDIRLFTPAEGRNALHYNGMAHGLVRIPVAGLAWSGAAAQADLDALAAAWRRAWGNAALPFRRLGKDDLNEGRMK